MRLINTMRLIAKVRLTTRVYGMFSSPKLEKGSRFLSPLLGKCSIGSPVQYWEKVVGSPGLYWKKVVYSPVQYWEKVLGSPVQYWEKAL